MSTMAEDVHEKDVVNPGSDPKFQRFAASVERALKGFEVSREWQDLISCLARLNKVLLAYVHFNVLPHKHLICRRLSQCLHPSLPGGVHLKVLDVYKVIFDRIGHDGLARDLFLYSSGLFPLMEYGSMQVKPVLIDLYEQYYLPLGIALLPGLSGVICALLPGLEEGSEYTEKVTALLDLLFSSSDPLAFVRALWGVVLSLPSLRLPALNYVLGKLNKDDKNIWKAVKRVDNCPDLLVSAFCSSLCDTNTLVQRSILDMIIQLLPLHSLAISDAHLIQLLMSAARCLLKRDQSIIRRVFIWLLGKATRQSDSSNDTEDVNNSSYFLTHTRPHLLVALKQIITLSSSDYMSLSDKANLLQPYRLLKIINEQSEILNIITELLPDILHCLKCQMNRLGGLPPPGMESTSSKKNGKRSQIKGELLYSSNQFWTGLDSDLLWGWINSYLTEHLKGTASSGDSLQERMESVLFLFNVLPLVNMEGALSLYLPNFLLHFTVTLTQSLPNLTLMDLHVCTCFIVQSLSLLKQYVQMTIKSTTIDDCALERTASPDDSPFIEKKLFEFSTSSNPFQESETTLGGLIMALLHQSQSIIQAFVSTHICDMEGVSSLEMVTMAANEALQSIDVLMVCKSTEESELAKNLSGVCALFTESLSLLECLSFDIQTTAGQEPSWLHALVLVSLRTNDIHLFVSSMQVILQLWLKAVKWSKEGAGLLRNVQCVIDLMKKRNILQISALYLWSLLSPDSSSHHHEEAAHLLSLLLSLAPLSVQIEGFLLEMFTKNSVKPYQQFAIFWKYLLQQENVPEFKLQRLILRMIEGLQSQNPAIHHCSSTWLITTCNQSHIHSAIMPLFALIKEACPSKIKAQKEAAKVEEQPHAKYCYTALNREVEEKPFTSPYPSFYFSQLVDAPRYSYGLALFLSVISTYPELICVGLANSYNKVLTPDLSGESRVSRSSAVDSIDDPATPTQSSLSFTNKSLLEVILAECTELLSSDYPHWLDTTETQQTSLYDVKVASTAVIIALLGSIMRVLNAKHSSVSAISANVQNPSYVNGLMTLCEVQKATLVALLNLLGPFTEHSQKPDTNAFLNDINNTCASSRCDTHHVQYSFVLHLLRCLYYQLIIESMTAESPVGQCTTATGEPLVLQYVPGNSLASQPMFHLLVQCIFTQAINVSIQLPSLVLIQSSLSYLRTSLEAIAPRILKILCRNLISVLKEKSSHECDICNGLLLGGHRECTCHVHCELLVCYMKTISSFVHYCLLPSHVVSHTLPHSLSLHYQMPDPFWDFSLIKSLDSKPSLNSPQMTPSVSQERQSFGLSWIIGGLFGSTSGRENDQQMLMVQSDDPYRGVSTPAGQKVLWLLPLVYNTLSQLWKVICCNGGKAHLVQDLKLLIKQFLVPLLEKNDVLFYSSIAQSWMQWNLGGRTKKPLCDIFIDLLHSFKLCSLEELLVSISTTLTNLKGDGDFKVNEERQKYLLHFLYRYISSPYLSSEELISCNTAMVTFLKDCHSTITTGVELGYFGNTPLLCMLTSILHVFVCRVPVPDLKTSKKQRRELQDLIYRLCDSLSQVALSQLLHNIDHTPVTDPSVNGATAVSSTQGGDETALRHSTELESSDLILKPSDIQLHDTRGSATHGVEVQAMAVLSNVLSHFVDCVYENSEKDRVVSLLKSVLRSVWPSLKNYNPSLSGCYIHAVKLIAKLSEFQVTRKCWKDEVMEWFLNSKFFLMEEASIKDWKIIIDNLMSQDKLMFRSLLIRIPSTAAGMVNMFSSLELERVQRAKLFKRMAFVILSGEMGQYSGLLQDIQEKLLDSVRWYSGPTLNAEVLVTFRVLLLKLSTDDLASLWPALLAELTAALSELHSDLSLELATPLKTSRDKLTWYYSACKILDTALSLPPRLLPQFQIVSWGYFGERAADKQAIGGLVRNILDSYRKESSQQEELLNMSIPLFHEVKTAVHLVPFLNSLATRAASVDSCELQLDQLESLMLLDFVEH